MLADRHEIEDIPPPSSDDSAALVDNRFADRDLALLLAGALRVNKDVGAVILKEGEINKSLFHINSGFVRVEKGSKVTNPPPFLTTPLQVLTTLGPGAMFGEISFLDQRQRLATASIVADGAVELLVLNSNYVNNSLKESPLLAARFFHSLASHTAKRYFARLRSAFPDGTWFHSHT
jgi:CRP-like cAMP-binding protein